MNNSWISSKMQLKQISSKAAIFVLVVSLLGFVDAAYLTVEHYRDVVPPCSITGGCENVLTSQFAEVAGIPVSLVGAVFYLFVLIGSFLYIESKKDLILRYGLTLSIPAFIASLYFVFLQVFVIRSYCAYCMGSAITSTIIFISAIKLLRNER